MLGRRVEWERRWRHARGRRARHRRDRRAGGAHRGRTGARHGRARSGGCDGSVNDDPEVAICRARRGVPLPQERRPPDSHRRPGVRAGMRLGRARAFRSRSSTAASIGISSATTRRDRAGGRCASSSARRTCSTSSTSGSARLASRRTGADRRVGRGARAQTGHAARAPRARGRAADDAAGRGGSPAGCRPGRDRPRGGCGARRREGPARRRARRRCSSGCGSSMRGWCRPRATSATRRRCSGSTPTPIASSRPFASACRPRRTRSRQQACIDRLIREHLRLPVDHLRIARWCGEAGTLITDIDVEKAGCRRTDAGRHDGQVVLVWGAIPGERVRARIERVGNGVLYAETAEVLNASPDRRDARRRLALRRQRLRAYRVRPPGPPQGRDHPRDAGPDRAPAARRRRPSCWRRRNAATGCGRGCTRRRAHSDSSAKAPTSCATPAPRVSCFRKRSRGSRAPSGSCGTGGYPG